jgi:serine/threonine protein kinase
MPSEERITEFDPDNVETISGWVLEFPFLRWVPSSREFPLLSVRMPDASTRELSVRGVLGRGGFGIVFLCVEDERRLAVKLPRLGPPGGMTVTDIGLRLDREITDQPYVVDKTFARRVDAQRQGLAAGLVTSNLTQILETFRSETGMLTRLKHPCIVPLEFSGEIVACQSDSGNELTLPCIAMQYINGLLVSEIVAGKKTWNLEDEFVDLLKTAHHLALALACIHDRRTCHRDLSWYNVMMTVAGLPMIIDLGNVALPEDAPIPQAQDTSDGKIDTFFVPYTPGFVAPEHRDGTRVIDGRGDQFSLGVMLYLWCSGRKNKIFQWPFDRSSGESNNSADRQVPIPLKELRRGFVSSWKPQLKSSFQWFSDILQRMMAWERDDRYLSLRDVASEIAMILQFNGHSSAFALDEHELQMDNSFQELCNQVSIPADETASCLVLQTLVRQARQQVSEMINSIWDAVFETWIDSKLQPANKARRMFKEGLKLESNLTMSLNFVLRTFQRVRMTRSPVPRFGGRLQQILGQSAPTTTLNRPPETDDPDLLQTHIDKQWDYFSRRQEQLAEVDYQLSLYSLQLSELRNRTKST